jgi:methionyl-tRNA formyltransferase
MTPAPSSRKRAIVFAYHNVGVRCLSTLLAHGVDVALVITHHDNPEETIWFGSVAELAALHDIPVIIPEDPNDPAVVAMLSALEPDFLFSFYYRLMLKAPLLNLPKCGAYNMHGSLLPRYRGRVPVNWAIIQGEHETGATLHKMLEKPDAGGIVSQQAVPILPNDTALDVFNKVTVAAELALDRILPELLNGCVTAQPQNLAQGSYFGGRKAEDGRIQWSDTAQAIHNLVRAVAPPYPGAYFDTKQGRFKILRSLQPTGAVGDYPVPTLFVDNDRLFAQCGDRSMLRLLQLEFDGRDVTAQNFPALVGATFLPLP